MVQDDLPRCPRCQQRPLLWRSYQTWWLECEHPRDCYQAIRIRASSLDEARENWVREVFQAALLQVSDIFSWSERELAKPQSVPVEASPPPVETILKERIWQLMAIGDRLNSLCYKALEDPDLDFENLGKMPSQQENAFQRGYVLGRRNQALLSNSEAQDVITKLIRELEEAEELAKVRPSEPLSPMFTPKDAQELAKELKEAVKTPISPPPEAFWRSKPFGETLNDHMGRRPGDSKMHTQADTYKSYLADPQDAYVTRSVDK